MTPLARSAGSTPSFSRTAFPACTALWRYPYFDLGLGLEGADVGVLAAPPGAHLLAGGGVEAAQRRRPLLGDQHRTGPITQKLLPHRLRLAETAVRRDHQDALRRAGIDGVRCRPQGRSRRAQRPGEVSGVDVGAHVQGGRDHPRALLLVVRSSGRGEEQAIDAGRVHPRQAVRARSHRHGEAVLVGVGNGPLAGDSRHPPGICHLLPGEPEQGNVGAE